MTTPPQSSRAAPPTKAPWRDGHAAKAPAKGLKCEDSSYGYFYRDRRSTTFAFLNRGEGSSRGDGSTPLGVKTLQALRDRVTEAEAPEFVWTPRRPEGVASELCPELTKTLTRQKLKESRKSARLSAFVCLFFLIIWLIPGGSPSSLIFFLLFGLIPLSSELFKLQAFRRHPLRQVRRNREFWLFRQWLGQKKAPATYALCAGLGVLAAIHFFHTGLSPGVKAAGLDPAAIAEGEVWRLISGPLIHGNFLHVSFNIIALWAFGRILERFCGSRTVLVVFTLSMLVGALASWGSLGGRTSVGASGGVLGLLAFLAVFAGRRPRLFPTGFSNSLGYNLLLIALLGLVLVQIIDNAAHLGGIACGALLALVYCRNPKTRQATNFVPNLFCWMAPHAAGLLICSVVWTSWVLIR